MNATKKGFNPTYANETPTLDEINNLAGITILEFGAPWCSHCLAAEPTVQKVLTEQTDLPHIKVHDGKGMRLGRAFKIKLWPTLVLLQNGIEVERLIRPVHADEVRQLLAKAE